MKLSQFDGQSADISGLSANNFRLEVNSKIYSMLTEKLYKDKPGAVIRELSCNAWDAHVEAGNSDVPFEIELPTWLNKSFSLRDYGTGIPHSGFEEIYTNIGASTKENSNDFVGAMGIGSKVGFTMTDTYLVENWKDGFKSTWVCFKDGGLPRVTRISLESNVEPSGLKVSFDFKSDSVDDFRNAIVKQLSFFPVKPVITGGERSNWDDYWPKIPDYTGKNYFYYESPHWTSDGVLLMGPVAYPFSKGDLSISNYGDPRANLFNKPLCIVAELGDVDIPPSRETLEFTDKTKRYIEKVLDSIRAEYRKTFDADLLTKDTFREAWIYLSDANKNLLPYKQDDILSIGNGKTYTYRELSTTWYTLPEYTLLRGRSDLKRKFASKGYNSLNANTFKNPDTKFYVDDLGIKGGQHLTDNYASFGTLRTTFIVKTRLKANAKLDLHKAAATTAIKVLKDNHGITASLVSDLIGFPVIPARAKGVRGAAVKVDQIFKVIDVSSGNYGDPYKLKTYKGECVTDIPDSGYFVEIHGANIVSTDTRADYSKLKVCYSYLSNKGDGSTPIYLVRTKSIKKLDVTKCRPLSELYPEITDYLETQDKLSDKRSSILNEIPQGLLSILQGIPELQRKDDKELQVLIRYYRRIIGIKLDGSIHSGYTSYLYSQQNFRAVPATTMNLTKLKRICTRISKEYERLEEFQTEYLSYRGSQQGFIKGIQDILGMIS